MVVITPDNKIYSCLFLAKPGLEIGELIDGEIMLNDTIKNDGNLCIAQEMCKNNEEFVSKVLKLKK